MERSIHVHVHVDTYTCRTSFVQDVICTGRHLYRTSFVQDVICTVRLCVSTDTPNRCCGWILSLSYQSVRACLQMHEMHVCRPIDKLSLRTRARTPYPRHTPQHSFAVCAALHCTALHCTLARSFVHTLWCSRCTVHCRLRRIHRGAVTHTRLLQTELPSTSWNVPLTFSPRACPDACHTSTLQFEGS